MFNGSANWHRVMDELARLSLYDKYIANSEDQTMLDLTDDEQDMLLGFILFSENLI